MEHIKAITPVDYWWNAQASDEMPIYDLGGKLYCAAGWNGEAYAQSFQVVNRFEEVGAREVELWPIYRFDAEGVDPGSVEEGSDEWDHLSEVVGFSIR